MGSLVFVPAPLLLLLLLASLGDPAGSYHIDNGPGSPQHARILKGTDAEIEQFPYQALLVCDRFFFYCGATIIAPRWLLTAAHCVSFRNNSSEQPWCEVSAVTGTTDFLREEGEYHAVRRLIPHERYNSSTKENDIGLVELEEPIVFGARQRPIRPSFSAPPASGQLLVSGYGAVSDAGGPAFRLQWALLPVIERGECEARYNHRRIKPSMFCAALGGPSDTCRGDSGGPAVLAGRLVGVISAGKACGSGRYPGVYTRLDLFGEWIGSRIGAPGGP